MRIYASTGRPSQQNLGRPETVFTGFIYKNAEVSSQINLLIINKGGCTLFKEGEFVIVTPHAVRAVIEVKTSLKKSDFDECLHKLAKNAKLAEQDLVQNRGSIWSGLFVYDGDPGDAKDLLLALSKAESDEDHPATCVAYGPDLFIKFRWATDNRGAMWVSHGCEGLAAGCFVMDMIAALTKSLGVSDFPVLNAPVLNGRIAPKLHIERGRTRVESLAPS